MRKMRSIIPSQGASCSVLCCTLLLAGCDSSQTDPLKDPAPVSGEVPGNLQEPVPADITPFQDLSGDTLIPPEQPNLSLSTQPGVLNFHWRPIEGQRKARLYRYDSQLGGETLTHEFDDPDAGNWQLQSHTHTTPWHRQQYRVELCTADDCVSSPRMSLSGLAANTLHVLSPAVYIQEERYAEQVALNHNASMAVLTLPVEGALEIHGRVGNQWTLIQRLRLDALSVSSTRSLDVALSDTGNTLAVFIKDSSTSVGQGIRILERLGEAWVETAAWLVDETIAAQVNEDADPQILSERAKTSLTLSSSGDQLLLQNNQTLAIYRQTSSGWSNLAQIIEGSRTDGAPQDQTAVEPVRLLASAHDAQFTRLFTLAEEDQFLYLDIWTPSQDAATWQRRSRFELQGLSTQAQLALRSNATGSSIIVAGWEKTDTGVRAPVLWRHDIEPGSMGNPSEPAFSLSLSDSLRAPPTPQADASLIFTADASLTIAALGWHSTSDPTALTPALPDAVLSTYVYDDQSRQWFSALELPENLPTLAKQSFGAETVLSDDGMTMLMTGQSTLADRASNRTNEVLIMR